MVEFKVDDRVSTLNRHFAFQIAKANAAPQSFFEAMIAMAKTHFRAFPNRNLIANHAWLGARFEGSWIAIHDTWHKFIDLQNDNIWKTF